tara:strand:- start:1715 stop:2566 length:852 start_codon:yes stop_codon:yes gene_type:complete
MYFLQNFFIWIRKNIIRILLKEYPNKFLKPSIVENDKSHKFTNFISSTDNFWVSRSMFKKWSIYNEIKDINVSIYSNVQVNNFMYEYFKDDLIYEIFTKSVIPVQKIDIFRICIIYKFGGIWLDLKSEINLNKVLKIYKEYQSRGILLYEPRKIEVINSLGNNLIKSSENVIHNGFFFLPKGSKFLECLLFKIKQDYLYFQDIVFNAPKQGIMNLTGPHQFTRTFYNIESKDRPYLASQKEVGWIFYSKFGEYISPIKGVKHYSYFRKLKTIDSKNKTILNEK